MSARSIALFGATTIQALATTASSGAVSGAYTVVMANGQAGVVVFTDSAYAIAIVKHDAMMAAVNAVDGSKVLELVDTPIAEVVATMEKHKIRRVPVVDERGSCAGIISQADVAWTGEEREVAELVREVSRDTGN